MKKYNFSDDDAKLIGRKLQDHVGGICGSLKYELGPTHKRRPRNQTLDYSWAQNIYILGPVSEKMTYKEFNWSEASISYHARRVWNVSPHLQPKPK